VCWKENPAIKPKKISFVETLIGLFMSPSIIVSTNDIFLGFIAGFFQVGLGFILITIGARSTPSAFVE
jgi:hypothetical protein